MGPQLIRVFWKMVYGNFFRKPFSAFSFAILRVKNKYFQVDFHFTSKQTSANAENILRKTFLVETNGAKMKKQLNYFM